jgi:hypothetical protein
MSLTYSGAVTGSTTAGFTFTDAYLRSLDLTVAGERAQGPVLALHRVGEPVPGQSTFGPPPVIVLQGAVGSTTPADVLLINRGSSLAYLSGHALTGPFSWRPLNLGLEFPGGAGPITVQGQAFSYCGATLDAGDECLLMLNYTPTQPTVAPPAQFTDTTSLTFTGSGNSSASRAIYGLAFADDGGFDAGPPRCPTTFLWRDGHCYTFTTETVVTAQNARLHAMARGADGGVHVVFFDDVARTESYTHRTAAGWSPRVTLAGAGTVSFSDLAIDRAGVPVAVFDAPSGSGSGIVWARLDPALAAPDVGWVRTWAPGHTYGTPRVAFDAANQMHVAYADGYVNQVVYAPGSTAGGFFAEQPVSSAGPTEARPRLAVTPGGAAYVAFTQRIPAGSSATSRAYVAGLERERGRRRRPPRRRHRQERDAARPLLRARHRPAAPRGVTGRDAAVDRAQHFGLAARADVDGARRRRNAPRHVARAEPAVPLRVVRERRAEVDRADERVRPRRPRLRARGRRPAPLHLPERLRRRGPRHAAVRRATTTVVSGDLTGHPCRVAAPISAGSRPARR